MTDERSDDDLDPVLQERFAVLDEVEPPDVWPGARRISSAPVGRRRALAAAAAVVVLVGAIGWATTRDDGTDGEVSAGADGDSVPATSPSPTTPSPFECPVTVPVDGAFVAPDPWAPDAPHEGAAWFGSDDLWTIIDIDGHTPRKSVWWSANFPGGAVEERPAIAVVYERLDEPGTVVDLGPDGTNANTALDGWFMIAGGEPETAGCWQATATYKGATLSYVYEVLAGQ